jgi:hypothetical protein
VVVDPRDTGTFTRHESAFELETPASTVSRARNEDKGKLREQVREMVAQGMSYRQISAALGIHWTRVGQIVKAAVD